MQIIGLEIHFLQMTGRIVKENFIGVDQFKVDPATRRIMECPSQGHKLTLSLCMQRKRYILGNFIKNIFRTVHY